MATSMLDSGMGDSRVMCSICMEPYKGRQPKLLPCFHTFCLPCLTALEVQAKQKLSTTENSAASPVDGSGEPSGAGTVTICCPTCRKDVTIPPEGAAGFQANFYVDDGRDEISKPAMCDLCDGSEPADQNCFKCQYGVCSKCARIHNKLCQSEVSSAKLKENGTTSELKQKAKDQLQVLDNALAKLADKEKYLDEEKRALDNTINTLYCEALGYLADARDAAFTSLRDTAQAEKEKLQAEITAAQSVKSTLSGATQHGCTDLELQSALMCDADLQRYKILSEANDQSSFFKLQRDDQAVQGMQASCCGFMGIAKTINTLPAGRCVDAATDGISMTEADNKDALKDSEILADMREELHSKLHDLTMRLERELKVVQDENRSLRHDLQSLKEESGRRSDVTVTQREFTAVRDKTTLLCQDMAATQAEKDKLCQQLTAVRAELNDKHKEMCKEVTTQKSENSRLNSEVAASKRLINSLEQKISSLQSSGRDTSRMITTLEKKISLSSSSVAFHAVLTTAVTTTSERVLILKHVEANLGGGYNTQTGIFVAPVTGVYLFIATSSPQKGEEDIPARLDIVKENALIGYLLALQSNTSSGHTVARVSAGERVWLRTYNERCRYNAGWWTTFTGVLVQPEV